MVLGGPWLGGLPFARKWTCSSERIHVSIGRNLVLAGLRLRAVCSLVTDTRPDSFVRSSTGGLRAASSPFLLRPRDASKERALIPLPCNRPCSAVHVNGRMRPFCALRVPIKSY